MTKKYNYDIGQAGSLLDSSEVTAAELVEDCLEQINKHNPELNAFITILADESREAAKHIDKDIKANGRRSPLHGIPVAVKDLYDTAGIKTTAAFEHFQNRVPKKDAESVRKLKEAGAIIVGKTNMHTLAMGTTSAESFYGAVP